MKKGVSMKEILKKLENQRIFKIVQQQDKYYLVEACDEYFSVELTKEMCIGLANEFNDLSKKIQWLYEEYPYYFAFHIFHGGLLY